MPYAANAHSTLSAAIWRLGSVDGALKVGEELHEQRDMRTHALIMECTTKDHQTWNRTEGKRTPGTGSRTGASEPVTAAPFGAIVALACGVTIDADATSAHTLEVIRTASWTMTAVATLWFGIIATARQLPRSKSAFEWRMLVERDSRMVYAANAQSVMCTAVTLTVVVAMVR